VAHSVPTNGRPRVSADDETSIGTLVQSAMADVSTLVRNEIELAKAEIGRSVKKAGIGGAFFGAAGAMAAFAGLFFFVFVAELLAIWLPQWLAWLIVFVALILAAGFAGFVGYRIVKKIDKPERTMESLRELPEVLHREEPGKRRRDLPTVAHGEVTLRDPDTYLV
jgi:pilus assembly protein TadC